MLRPNSQLLTRLETSQPISKPVNRLRNRSQCPHIPSLYGRRCWASAGLSCSLLGLPKLFLPYCMAHWERKALRQEARTKHQEAGLHARATHAALRGKLGKAIVLEAKAHEKHHQAVAPEAHPDAIHHAHCHHIPHHGHYNHHHLFRLSGKLLLVRPSRHPLRSWPSHNGRRGRNVC